MTHFFRGVEIWLPNKQRTSLVLDACHYSGFGLKQFKQHSKQETFDFNEGLPGNAWAAGKPVLLKELTPQNFKRYQIAQQIHLNSGLAFPIFSGSHLLAVTVFLFSHRQSNAGGIELWAKGNRDELVLQNGYYGAATNFAYNSKMLRVPKGKGLIGQAWATGLPTAINIANSSYSQRAEPAIEAGITMGLALPCYFGVNEPTFLSLLSAEQVPITQQFDIWLYDDATGALNISQRITETGEQSTDGVAAIAGLLNPIGRTVLSGLPQILKGQALAAVKDNFMGKNPLAAALVLPILDAKSLRANVVFYF